MTRFRTASICCAALALGLGLAACAGDSDHAACASMAGAGLRPVAAEREDRFLGKVQEDTARCRGGERTVALRDTPWLDWSRYWATGDQTSTSGEDAPLTFFGEHLQKDGRGIDGALLDLEYQRIELIKFNLFDSRTFATYVRGADGVGGRAVKVWPEMRLPADDPAYAAVGGAGEQLCRGELIRHRTLTGICNDIRNPAMGASGQLFARNVQFEETFPELSDDWWVRNRHDGRIALLRPDPQVISRKLLTRAQSAPELCNAGAGLPGHATDARCDYKKAPFFNVLAAYWIQFMTHDWFSHLAEARNDARTMPVGCAAQKVAGVERPLTPAEVAELGCRPDDRMEQALVAEDGAPPRFEHEGRSYQGRAQRTTRNSVTAWWDASQIYGYDERSLDRVRRDPGDPAKLLMVKVPGHDGAGERYGYLPAFAGEPIQPEWAGQEAAAFPDNWSIGLSFLHNLFVREHNLFVDAFRARAGEAPDADSGLRDPAAPAKPIRYRDVGADRLFEVARLVVAAEIAKIHTIEWTPQLLYDEPLAIAMDSNWNGLLKDHPRLETALAKVVDRLARSTDEKDATQWYSVFATGPGIIGTGSRPDDAGWSLAEPDDVAGGVNHFGSPFNFPEEFITVYRLHALLPDLLEVRDLAGDPDAIAAKMPVIDTFRGKATPAMHEVGLASWALSLGRQRLGALALQNHPQFLQNLVLGERLATPTRTIDVVGARHHPRPRARRAALQRVPPPVRPEAADQLRRLHRPAPRAQGGAQPRGAGGARGPADSSRRCCARSTARTKCDRRQDHQPRPDRRGRHAARGHRQALSRRLPRPPRRQRGRQRRGPRHGGRLARRDHAAARLRDLGDAVPGVHPQRLAPALQRPLLHLELPARALQRPRHRLGAGQRPGRPGLGGGRAQRPPPAGLAAQARAAAHDAGARGRARERGQRLRPLGPRSRRLLHARLAPPPRRHRRRSFRQAVRAAFPRRPFPRSRWTPRSVVLGRDRAPRPARRRLGPGSSPRTTGMGRRAGKMSGGRQAVARPPVAGPVFL